LSLASPVLEVRNLVKVYPGDVKAVNGISFSLEAGLCLGLLGPNGAGKTTTLEMIEDTLSLTEGEILYKGQPRGRHFKEEVGIQFQSTELPQYLTVGETLKTFHSLYTRQADLQEIIATCQLQDLLKRDNRRISGGQKQRLLLALALLNAPDLVFLDEPTTGMDPQARRNLWDSVIAIKEQGKTLVLTTHYMDEAQLLCDRVAIVDQGRILSEGTPRELIQRNCPYVSVVLPLQTEAALLADLPWPQTRRSDGIEIRATEANACIQELLRREINLTEISIHTPTLEDVFLVLTGKSLRE
jgi:ABC-2 type transport system ATP-binding protein